MASTEDIAIFMPSLVLASGIRVRHFSSIGRLSVKWLLLVVFLKQLFYQVYIITDFR